LSAAPPSLVTVEYQLAPAELARVQIMKVLRKRLWMFVFLIALAAYLWGAIGPHPMTIGLTIAIPLYALALGAYVWWSAAERDSMATFGRRTVEFADELIIIRLADGSESKFRYDHMQRAVESRNFLELRMSKTRTIIIPRRAFATADDLDEVRTLLREEHLL